MNQILYFKQNNMKYKIQFIISIVIFTISIIILFINIYKAHKNETISNKLMSSYSVTTLYSNSLNEDTINLDTDETEPFVIGIIKIDKINLNYPILSSISNDLLDISVCRFAGPMPNEIGNLCIAGHNYVDYKLFSRVNELKKDDTIEIYDLDGQKIEYSIYDIYETNADDTSCTFQDTNGNRIVTLITCNNVNGKRLIVHAKEIPRT